ncbi:MAG: hypothetical protein COV36_05095 [Alphaproteobacteria bacterium CG11_big_fil_rev_8_21_14_0_20_44_7]|nr:MAG: hypothetical protein COV36_05095 [Alphaproteobacteria bacterium CG11_big_fil_rev_8_21_14_0_20_44_7]
MAEYAIIAGTGRLPEIVSEKLTDKLVLGLEGNTNPNIKYDFVAAMGSIGAVTEYLQNNNVKKVIFAGAVKKPDLKQIKLDAVGAKLMSRAMAARFFGAKQPGDDYILSTIIVYLEKLGFEVIGAHEVCPELVVQNERVCKTDINDEITAQFSMAMEAAKELGQKDIGQAVVVANGEVIASEDVLGTENLIKRAGQIAKERGVIGFLAKCAKPQQNMRVDMPTIGADTIEQLYAAGLKGVVVESGKTLILDRENAIAKAAEKGVFIIGL